MARRLVTRNIQIVYDILYTHTTAECPDINRKYDGCTTNCKFCAGRYRVRLCTTCDGCGLLLGVLCTQCKGVGLIPIERKEQQNANDNQGTKTGNRRIA